MFDLTNHCRRPCRQNGNVCFLAFRRFNRNRTQNRSWVETFLNPSNAFNA